MSVGTRTTRSLLRQKRAVGQVAAEIPAARKTAHRKAFRRIVRNAHPALRAVENMSEIPDKRRRDANDAKGGRYEGESRSLVAQNPASVGMTTIRS